MPQFKSVLKFENVGIPEDTTKSPRLIDLPSTSFIKPKISSLNTATSQEHLSFLSTTSHRRSRNNDIADLESNKV